ncbi:MAG TPA: phospholipase D-like domain-containing protein [Gemmatimonadaceae bacterium]|nr:phospholipase D-like domain-containing protein [Gemmatimonadaceae bacterium]
MKTAGIIFLVLLVVLFALIGVLYATRGTPLRGVRAVGEDKGRVAITDPLFAPTISLLTTTSLGPAGEVELLTNGDETYPRLWDDLRSATRSITLQMYYAQPGKVANTLKDILLDRVRAGVRVLFLHDAFGSQNLTKEYLDSLRVAGVEIAVFRPVHWYSLHKAQHRSHIRVVVVDGAVAYTGGFGLDDKWLGDGRTGEAWRDTNVRFTGPAVLQLQATFAAGWVEATGQLITGDIFFPLEPVEPKHTGKSNGPVRADSGRKSQPELIEARLSGIMHAAPTIGSTPAERFLALSIAAASKTLYIANSYFVPDDDFRRLLGDAARRGVDVRVLTTSDKTDVKTTWYAGRSTYEELLSAGVRVYEYQPSMMHAKTISVDGIWSTVGTMNFDNRSMVFNDESNLLVLDREFGAAMDSVFLQDLQYAKEITLEEFRRRPWTKKLAEKLARGIARLL